MWPPFSIRAATEGDCEAIAALLNHYIATSTCIFREDEQTLEETRAWLLGRRPDHPVIVAEEDGVVVGMGSLGPFRPKSGYRRTVEDSVYVSPHHHRRGIGGALLGRLVELAQEHGHHQIVAVIEANQPDSFALHARFGFVEAGRLREVGTKFGRWLDAVYFQRPLEPPAPS